MAADVLLAPSIDLPSPLHIVKTGNGPHCARTASQESGLGSDQQLVVLKRRGGGPAAIWPQRLLVEVAIGRRRTSLLRRVCSSGARVLGSEITADGPGSVLVPRVVITTDVDVVEGRRRTFWAAVEVAASVSGPKGGEWPRTSPGPPGQASSDQAARYEWLYDVDVNVLASPGARILEIIESPSSPTTLSLGEAILMLVRIRLDEAPSTVARPTPARLPSESLSGVVGGHGRQRSDDLMDDLELQLGSQATEYMQVNVRYGHSAFAQPWPTSRDLGLQPEATADGIVRSQTRIETVASAAICRQHSRSPWSPRANAISEQPNPIIAVIGRDWPPDEAAEAVRRVLGAEQRLVTHGSERPNDSGGAIDRNRPRGHAAASAGRGAMRRGMGSEVSISARSRRPIPATHSNTANKSKDWARWGWAGWWQGLSVA